MFEDHADAVRIQPLPDPGALVDLPADQPARSTIFRTGRLLTPSMPVSSLAFPARQ